MDNVRWQNPHIYFDVTTDDRTTYLVEWTKMWGFEDLIGLPVTTTRSPVFKLASGGSSRTFLSRRFPAG